MSGIVSYGVHLPYWRLQRSAIGQALGQPPGRGTRSVASYDEDTTSMGVEAARRALAAAPAGYAPHALWFATTEPAYLDKTNATAIHAALGLPSWSGAYDAIGGVRSGIGAAMAAGSGTQVAVLSDLRTGLPGGADEAAGGDAAVALCFGDTDPIAVTVGGATAVREFTDRWRAPGEIASQQWEERFGEHAYLPLAEEALAAALKGADLTAGDLHHVIVAGLHARAVKAVPRACGIDPGVVAPDLTDLVGNPGVAQWALVLADVLDRAEPGQTIAVVILADGVNVWLLRTTDALVSFRDRQRDTVRAQIERTRDDLTYQQFLTWRGLLVREPPRRPEPDRPAAPPSLRTEDWKFGLVGRRDANGFVTLPPSRVSVTGEVDAPGEPVRMADVRATIATFTVDRLAYSLSPPVVAAIIDFDGGGRFQCELTDVDPATVAIGDRVEMTFRRLYTSGGIHDYFWKARPLPRT
ncbi:MAG: OB-fold domain-containing protein [Ilumatobacteraceae bacterium]|nr:OB-fold domain-containing protein [Ilumatobacteraceae bacterium]